MLYRKGNRWELCPFKVRYTQHNETIEQYALPNKQWWTDFADKWEHTEIIEFTEIDITEDMQSRFEEIKNMPEDFSDIYTEYVLTGDVGVQEIQTNHPFNIIRLRKEAESLSKENTMLKLSVNALTDRSVFMDDVIEEIAMKIYD